jgi:hypothetical protein
LFLFAFAGCSPVDGGSDEADENAAQQSNSNAADTEAADEELLAEMRESGVLPANSEEDAAFFAKYGTDIDAIAKASETSSDDKLPSEFYYQVSDDEYKTFDSEGLVFRVNPGVTDVMISPELMILNDDDGKVVSSYGYIREGYYNIRLYGYDTSPGSEYADTEAKLRELYDSYRDSNSHGTYWLDLSVAGQSVGAVKVNRGEDNEKDGKVMYCFFLKGNDTTSYFFCVNLSHDSLLDGALKTIKENK